MTTATGGAIARCSSCGQTQPTCNLEPTLDPQTFRGRCRRDRRSTLWTRVADPRPRDVEQGIARGAAGMARAAAAEASIGDWNVRARRWIDARTVGDVFTSDDLTAAIGLPARHAAVGSAFAAARRRGAIERAGVRPSEIVTSNGSVTFLWRRSAAA